MPYSWIVGGFFVCLVVRRILTFIFIYEYVWISLWVYATVRAVGGQTSLDPLELVLEALQAVRQWALGTELRSSGRAASALNC